MKAPLSRKLGLTAVLALITTLIGCPASDQAYVPTKIYMFSAGLHTGDLGRRAGADAQAEAAVAGAGLAGPVRYAHAFISANSFDCIANMPFIFDIPPNLPIYAPNGTTLIANNWGELLDNSYAGEPAARYRQPCRAVLVDRLGSRRDMHFLLQQLPGLDCGQLCTGGSGHGRRCHCDQQPMAQIRFAKAW